MLSATLVHPVAEEPRLCEAVLDAADSLMTYRSRYQTLLRPAPTIDLLVTGETNPRSIRFQLVRTERLIGQLPDDASEVGLGIDERVAAGLAHRLRMSDSGELSKLGQSGTRARLNAILETTVDELPKLSDAISARYLIHTAATQNLTGVSTAEPTSSAGGNGGG